MLELKGVLEEWRGVPDSLESGMGDDDLIMGSTTYPPSALADPFQRHRIDARSATRSQISQPCTSRSCRPCGRASRARRSISPSSQADTSSPSPLHSSSSTRRRTRRVRRCIYFSSTTRCSSASKSDGGRCWGTAARCGSSPSGASTSARLSLLTSRTEGVRPPRSVESSSHFPDLTNAVKIKRGKETIIFRTDRPEDKKALLMAFKKVAEELMNKRRKDILSVAEAREGNVSLA